MGAGPGGAKKLSAEKIQELINEMQKKQPPAPATPPGDAAPAEGEAPPADAPPPMLAPIPDAPAPAPSGAP
jgi:hypothetical protein